MIKEYFIAYKATLNKKGYFDYKEIEESVILQIHSMNLNISHITSFIESDIDNKLRNLKIITITNINKLT